MNYSVRIEKNAYKTLSQIKKQDRIRIIDAIDSLKEKPTAGKVLRGRWEGLRRIRVGKYRVIYSIREKELLILVLRIGHRKDVYR